MEQRYLGEHGLRLSSVALGTRTWGLDTDAHEAADMLQHYADAQGTTLEVEDDPRYLEPSSTLGKLLEAFNGDLFQLILRSGARGFYEDSPAGVDRGSLLSSLEGSLRRLGTDHVDLWLLEGPLGRTRVEELVSAAELAWRSGKARYVGLGSVPAWDAGRVVTLAETSGFPFSAWAERISVLEPIFAGSSAHAARRAGMGIVAGAPLAGGLLTGKYQHSTPPDARATSPRFETEFARYSDSSTRAIVEATRKAAGGLDRSPAQVALAWAKEAGGVTTTVVGPRNVRQLDHLLELGDWTLPGALKDVLTEVAIEKISQSVRAGGAGRG